MANRFEYTVNPYPFDDGSQGFFASLVKRPKEGAMGTTPEDAIAGLIQFVAEQAYERQLLPDCPEMRVECDAIQRAMSLLATELRREVHARDQLTNVHAASEEPDMEYYLKKSAGTELARRSERIGNLGTAIAALSRVKEPIGS